MKKFKDFLLENKEIENSIYYKIIIDGSFDKFVIALERLGIKDDFYSYLDINDFSDLSDDNQDYFSKEFVYLAIYKSTYSDFAPTKYVVRNYFNDLPYSVKKLKNGGSIKIEDCEIDSNKFNI